MNTVLLIVVIVSLLVINVLLWKFGFVHESENPKLVDDKTFMDARQRKAILKRLDRWKEEGKISVEEHNHWIRLCEEDW